LESLRMPCPVRLCQSWLGLPSSITLLSIFLLIACGFRKLAGHGVECQAMAAEY
jgi:hypothetical protein